PVRPGNTGWANAANCSTRYSCAIRHPSVPSSRPANSSDASVPTTLTGSIANSTGGSVDGTGGVVGAGPTGASDDEVGVVAVPSVAGALVAAGDAVVEGTVDAVSSPP